MKSLRFSALIIFILLASCISEDEISRRVSGTLTALPSFTIYPTYTNYPTFTSHPPTITPTITPTFNYQGLAVWSLIVLMPDAFNISIDDKSCNEGTLKYQSNYSHVEIKAFYLKEMPKDTWKYWRDACEITNCKNGKGWDNQLIFSRYEGGISGHTYCATINIGTIAKIINVNITLSECFID
jgi:hypothetical protein